MVWLRGVWGWWGLRLPGVVEACALLSVVVLGVLGWQLVPGVGSAAVPVPSAEFAVSSDAVPSVFSMEHNGGGAAAGDSYALTVTNSGSRATDGSPVVISDVLPPGVVATGIAGAEIEHFPEKLACDLSTLTCTLSEAFVPGDTLRVDITVRIEPGAAGVVQNAVTVSGGGVSPVSTVQNNPVGTGEESLAEPFGFQRFTNEVNGVDGQVDTQAGDHPFQITNSFLLNTAYGKIAGFKLGAEPSPAGGVDGVEAELKDVVVELPPGFIGDPQAVPKCPQYKVYEVINALKYACPRETQIGEAVLYLSANALLGEERGTTSRDTAPIQVSPIFNVQPDKGYPAQFALQASKVIVTLYATVNAETNYGVRVLVKDIPPAGGALGGTLTFFGSPATNPNLNNPPRSTSEQVNNVAFLDNPTDCTAGPQYAKVYADTWEDPGSYRGNGSPDLTDPAWVKAEALTFPSITGCDLLQFDPSLQVQPSTLQADEPTGLTVHVKVPQAAQEFPLLATPPLKNATVTLPAGLSVNPSAADGLQGCSEAQIKLSEATVGECPQASQLGTVKVRTPLLPASEPLVGQVFLATPRCDPCSSADAADGNMARIYLQAQGSGVVVKKEGTIYINTSTGQLTTTFTEAPQVPFSDLELQFKSGLRAPLATPQACGTFEATSDLTPWSTPVTPDANSISPFDIGWEASGGGACPASLPFAPSFSAGTSNPDAGQYSPLTVTIGREDREQDLAGVQVTTPPGLLGSLSGIPLCGEPQSSLGTCPQASKLGSMTVAAGAGPHPFYERGSLYLTGPYKGAPFGLSIVVPTIAGPFNLGNVVVRARINIDPETSALTVTSDQLPQIIDGIPLRLRTANVTIEREHFIFNPTNCTQQHITAHLTGANGATREATVPFAVSGCAGLHFEPKFKATTKADTSREYGASLDVQLTVPPSGQSNIAKVKVELPKQMPSRLTTLQKACVAATFEANPATCPPGSLVGYAKANSPLLPVPVTGPAYFVSHGGAKFPELIVVLQGYGVRIDLHGETFISKKGITSSTFSAVPDVPVEAFQLYLPQATNSALAANGNFCKEKLTMPITFTAQDGTTLKTTTTINTTGCPKTTTTKKTTKAKKAATGTPAHTSNASREIHP
jgi:hypothetical protein